jgi:hypothetical protein
VGLLFSPFRLPSALSDAYRSNTSEIETMAGRGREGELEAETREAAVRERSRIVSPVKRQNE